jgi:hypothetical protein
MAKFGLSQATACNPVARRWAPPKDRPFSSKVTTVLDPTVYLFLSWPASIAHDTGDLRIRHGARVNVIGFFRSSIESTAGRSLFRHDLMDC